MEAMELEDSFLVGRISGGDPEAFAGLFDRHAAAVLGLLVRILGAGGEAEEVLQEVFLQVWRQSERYEPGRSTPRGWLLMVARSRALDRLRRRDARGRHEQAAATDAAFPRVAAPQGTDRLEESERRTQVHSALNPLPPAPPRFLELAPLDGFTPPPTPPRLPPPPPTSH